MEINFNENEIGVLSGVNGKGKTTILSHIVDAFYEMVKPHFLNEFENKTNKFYRISSTIYSLNINSPSFVYLRFKTIEGHIDYVDIRDVCTEIQYNEAININDKILFQKIEKNLKENQCSRFVSKKLSKDKAIKIFSKNILTYFPSYRYEQPGYLNEPYKVNINFKKQSEFAGHLRNPIEVISGLPQLVNWIMDVVLDNQYLNVKPEDIKQTLTKLNFKNEITKDNLPDLINTIIQINIQEKSEIQKNLNSLLTNTLISKKYGKLRFGIGLRGFGSTRLQIVNAESGNQIYPSVFNISSGESTMLCLFGEILRQADNNQNNIPFSEITGVVLIDEVDKHLHIKLQKEILPDLFNIFPNVQFIVSSHSPFLNMGLAEKVIERSKIIDLDNLGISKDPTRNELYTEVYNMMISENERFKVTYESLEAKIKEGTTPLIITEGKTDIQHIKKAKEKLNIFDLKIDYFEVPENGWNNQKLKTLLENLCKVNNARKVIGVFDRDEKDILKDIEKDNHPFKNYGNNVFAFCIPVPADREKYLNISIEFYYTDSELKKEKDGKCLYFDNELIFNIKRKPVSLISEPTDSTEKKIYCEDIGNLNWLHSKARFAELVESDADFIYGFNFDNFKLIFEKVRSIINREL